MSEETPVVETIQVRLERVAQAINNRYGQFPDADLIREAIAYIDALEAPSTKVEVEKKTPTTTKEKN